MALRTLTPKAAAALDEELMSTGSFTIDQLMELAGLAVAQCQHRLSPPSRTRRLLIACGPGNNGGDGLVAARHLALFGYAPTVFQPKPGRAEIQTRLRAQLRALGVRFAPVADGHGDFPAELARADAVIDAVFGFSFAGEVREPFGAVVRALAETPLPVLAVDAPSGWNVETGPPADGPATDYAPRALISLTAPKPLVRWFKGRHFVGGRFVGREVAEKHGFDVPPYEGDDQVVEVPVGDVDGGKL